MNKLKELIKRIEMSRRYLERANRRGDTEIQFRMLRTLAIQYPILLDEIKKIIETDINKGDLK